jgi:hypothetical protein
MYWTPTDCNHKFTHILLFTAACIKHFVCCFFSDCLVAACSIFAFLASVLTSLVTGECVTTALRSYSTIKNTSFHALAQGDCHPATSHSDWSVWRLSLFLSLHEFACRSVGRSVGLSVRRVNLLLAFASRTIPGFSLLENHDQVFYCLPYTSARACVCVCVRACCSVVVKALGYKPKGRGFETR